MTPRRLILGALLFLLTLDWVGPLVARASGPPSWVWLMAGAALLLLGALWVAVYSHHKTQELRATYLVSEDWERMGSWQHRDAWICPRCSLPAPDLAHAEAHMDPERSACAAFTLHLEDVTTDVKQNVPGAGWPAVIPPEGTKEDPE